MKREDYCAAFIAEHAGRRDCARRRDVRDAVYPATFEFIINLKRGTAIESLPRRLQPVDVSAHREVERRALAQFRSHLDVIYSGQPAPLAANYDHYLTAEEPFLVELSGAKPGSGLAGARGRASPSGTRYAASATQSSHAGYNPRAPCPSSRVLASMALNCSVPWVLAGWVRSGLPERSASNARSH